MLSREELRQLHDARMQRQLIKDQEKNQEQDQTSSKRSAEETSTKANTSQRPSKKQRSEDPVKNLHLTLSSFKRVLSLLNEKIRRMAPTLQLIKDNQISDSCDIALLAEEIRPIVINLNKIAEAMVQQYQNANIKLKPFINIDLLQITKALTFTNEYLDNTHENNAKNAKRWELLQTSLGEISQLETVINDEIKSLTPTDEENKEFASTETTELIQSVIPVSEQPESSVDPQEMLFLFKEVEAQLPSLPLERWETIFSYLQASTLLNFRAVSREARAFILSFYDIADLRDRFKIESYFYQSTYITGNVTIKSLVDNNYTTIPYYMLSLAAIRIYVGGEQFADMLAKFSIPSAFYNSLVIQLDDIWPLIPRIGLQLDKEVIKLIIQKNDRFLLNIVTQVQGNLDSALTLLIEDRYAFTDTALSLFEMLSQNFTDEILKTYFHRVIKYSNHILTPYFYGKIERFLPRMIESLLNENGISKNNQPSNIESITRNQNLISEKFMDEYFFPLFSNEELFALFKKVILIDNEKLFLLMIKKFSCQQIESAFIYALKETRGTCELVLTQFITNYPEFLKTQHTRPKHFPLFILLTQTTAGSVGRERLGRLMLEKSSIELRVKYFEYILHSNHPYKPIMKLIMCYISAEDLFKLFRKSRFELITDYQRKLYYKIAEKLSDNPHTFLAFAILQSIRAREQKLLHDIPAHWHDARKLQDNVFLQAHGHELLISASRSLPYYEFRVKLIDMIVKFYISKSQEIRVSIYKKLEESSPDTINRNPRIKDLLNTSQSNDNRNGFFAHGQRLSQAPNQLQSHGSVKP